MPRPQEPIRAPHPEPALLALAQQTKRLPRAASPGSAEEKIALVRRLLRSDSRGDTRKRSRSRQRVEPSLPQPVRELPLRDPARGHTLDRRHCLLDRRRHPLVSPHARGKRIVAYTGGSPPHPWTVYVADTICD